MAETLDNTTTTSTSPAAQPIGAFTQGILSASDGTPSSTRILMITFSIFTMVILGAIVRHMIKLTDVTILTLWLGSFPMITTVLIGLIVTPYTVGQGAGAVGTIFNAISSARNPK